MRLSYNEKIKKIMSSSNTTNVSYQVTVPSGANFLNTITRTRLPQQEVWGMIQR